MPPLNDSAREALAEYKRDVSPGDGTRRANWAAIEKAIASDELTAAHAVPVRRAPSLLIGLTVAAAAAGVLLGIGLRPQVFSDERAGAAAASQYIEGSADAPESTEPAEPSDLPKGSGGPVRSDSSDPTELPVPLAEPAAEPVMDLGATLAPEQERASEGTPSSSRTETSSSSPSRKVRPRAARAEANQPTSVDPIAAVRQEARLVARARAALAGGNPERALEIVAAYRDRFGDGALAEEAAVLELSALCTSGPAERWRRAKTSYDAQHPSSPLRAHVRDDCFDAP